MEISIDAAIPTVTDGLVFQILTIWQAIKMSYVSLSFHILFIFLSSFCWDICHFFVSFSKCQVFQMLQAHKAYTMLLLVKQKNSILPRKIPKVEKRITCKLEQAKQPRLNPPLYPWSSWACHLWEFPCDQVSQCQFRVPKQLTLNQAAAKNRSQILCSEPYISALGLLELSICLCKFSKLEGYEPTTSKQKAKQRLPKVQICE
jgi:hypothetical protein